MLAIFLQLLCLLLGIALLFIQRQTGNNFQEPTIPSRGKLTLLPAGEVFRLDRDFLTIGRSKKHCAVYIRDPDAKISRQHADLVYQPEGGTYRIVPLSQPGSLSINQLPVPPEGQLLHSGDRISLLGQFELIYEQEGGR